jgi:Flp pilus assembly pilin Flp
MLDYFSQLYSRQLANSTGESVFLGNIGSDPLIHHRSSGSNLMKKLFRNNRGTTAVEFAIVIVPVLLFIVGIIQTACIVWADNLLHIAVDTATRCGAVTTSSTAPCSGSGLTNMKNTANAVFAPFIGTQPNWQLNTNCSAGSTGLVGTYQVSIISIVNLTLTASSCFPTVIVQSLNKERLQL